MNGIVDLRLTHRMGMKIWAAMLALTIPSFGQSLVGPAAEAPSAVRASRVVVISVPDRKLAVMDGANVIATFDVAVGAATSPSPTGEFRIVSRVANPTYYHPGTVIPSGKNNPIGTRWLGLSQKGYGIHGTNAPKSVGHAASHGCIRLRNRDVESLFSMLRTGDVVEIHGERDVQVARIFRSEEDDIVAVATAPSQSGGQ